MIGCLRCGCLRLRMNSSFIASRPRVWLVRPGRNIDTVSMYDAAVDWLSEIKNKTVNVNISQVQIKFSQVQIKFVISWKTCVRFVPQLL